MKAAIGNHLGDGAYVAYDGCDWTLNAERSGGVHYVVLGRRELLNLVGVAVRSDPDLAAGIRAALDWAATS